MPDRPTDPVDLSSPEAPGRSLSEILTELAQLSHSQQGDASEMRSAVSELSRSLARLFEMIRTDRHEQRTRIAQLERELSAMRRQLADLGLEPAPAPAPNDFDELRAAAERLRLRTEQLVRESRPAEELTEDAEEIEAPLIGGGLGPGAPSPADPPPAMPEDAPAVDEAEVSDEPGIAPAVEVGLPVLRVIDGDGEDAPVVAEVEASEPAILDEPDLEVESDLPIAQAEAIALPAPETEAPAAEAEQPAAFASTSPSRPEPIPLSPRAAAKRGMRPRRRRVDARKLVGVEPAAALGSMVGAVDQLWTAGCAVDLVIAFTDGGALRVSGGDRVPLRLEEVEPGTPARCTITATRRQLLPLFGRLELSGEESAPLIHGNRRDADLLVGWFDRAQRLAVAPL